MIDYYSTLARQYPIYSIEDGLDEGDHQGWAKLNEALGKEVLLVGDDLFVTNKKILQEIINKNLANAILVKVNQIGTLSETFEAMQLAYDHQYEQLLAIGQEKRETILFLISLWQRVLDTLKPVLQSLR